MDEFKFNIGIDCEDIERWVKMLPKLENGVERKLFSEKEHLYCRTFKNPAPHYAVRWCAKEAVYKAFSSFCKLDLRDIEILNDESGMPRCEINNPEVLTIKPVIKVSLSHTKQTAIAIALVIVTKPMRSEKGE
ncbi:MAG: holo-ACP synthase [Bacillota bacterium]